MGRVTVSVIHGDASALPLPDESIDAIVCDPPYGLEFMGKEWDTFDRGGPASFVNLGSGMGRERTGTAHGGGRSPVVDKPRLSTMGPVAMRAFQDWCEVWAREAFRVLKPGGYLLAFGGTRTFHRLTVGIEDAGFEIRDSLSWLYGSGFPKSLDVSKAIDKAAGAEREITGTHPASRAGGHLQHGGANTRPWQARALAEGHGGYITAPATDEARRWSGYGTALKPGWEPIVVARKPLRGTVAACVVEFGTGALNIDACRVGTEERFNPAAGNKPGGASYRTAQGRWPSNVVFTHDIGCDDEGCVSGCPVAELDTQSGTSRSAARTPTGRDTRGIPNGNTPVTRFADTMERGHDDEGGASRFFPGFFYNAKAPGHERPSIEGVGGPNMAAVGMRRCTACGKQAVNVTVTAQCQCPDPEWVYPETSQAVSHPTVKPVDLMRWLIRLVTPPGGVGLDMFAGSGSTGEAAILEGFDWILIENEAKYLPLIQQRLDPYRDPVTLARALGQGIRPKRGRRKEAVDEGLF